MVLINESIKTISCSDFRVFLKRLIIDKIEKEWSEDFVDQMNFVNVPRMTIRRRYENKGIDLIKLINDTRYYQHVKKSVNSRGNLEFDKKQAWFYLLKKVFTLIDFDCRKFYPAKGRTLIVLPKYVI